MKSINVFELFGASNILLWKPFGRMNTSAFRKKIPYNIKANMFFFDAFECSHPIRCFAVYNVLALKKLVTFKSFKNVVLRIFCIFNLCMFEVVLQEIPSDPLTFQYANISDFFSFF